MLNKWRYVVLDVGVEQQNKNLNSIEYTLIHNGFMIINSIKPSLFIFWRFEEEIVSFLLFVETDVNKQQISKEMWFMIKLEITIIGIDSN